LFLLNLIYTKEEKRIDDMTRASGACVDPSQDSEDYLIDIVSDKEFMSKSGRDRRSTSTDPTQSGYYYVKPGGTYYITTVLTEDLAEITKRRTDDGYSISYGPYVALKIFPQYYAPVYKEKLPTHDSMMSHPDIEQYRLSRPYPAGTKLDFSQGPWLLFRSTKVCLNGDVIRADCWMGRFGLGPEETNTEANQYLWRIFDPEALPLTTPACPVGMKVYDSCDTPALRDSLCYDGPDNNNIWAYTCERPASYFDILGAYGRAPGFGPN